VEPFHLEDVAARLGPGGYEVFFDSPTLELGVYVLVASQPDDQEPHDQDEIYVVLEGSGVLTVAGEETELRRGDAAFVAAGTEHRFSAYQRLTLLVLFDKTTGPAQ
jgi:mannose-6-phosphate isomerase-like protein (cupin superfamily)